MDASTLPFEHRQSKGRCGKHVNTALQLAELGLVGGNLRMEVVTTVSAAQIRMMRSFTQERQVIRCACGCHQECPWYYPISADALADMLEKIHEKVGYSAGSSWRS